MRESGNDDAIEKTGWRQFPVELLAANRFKTFAEAAEEGLDVERDASKGAASVSCARRVHVEVRGGQEQRGCAASAQFTAGKVLKMARGALHGRWRAQRDHSSSLFHINSGPSLIGNLVILACFLAGLFAADDLGDEIGIIHA